MNQPTARHAATNPEEKRERKRAIRLAPNELRQHHRFKCNATFLGAVTSKRELLDKDSVTRREITTQFKAEQKEVIKED